MNPYTSYYIKQAQTGISSGHYPSQHGKGLGNWLSAIAKSVYPYIRSGFGAVTDEILSAGIGLASDKLRNVPLKDSLSSRVKNLGTGLTDRAVNKIQSMTGSGGIKRKKRTTNPHSSAKRRRVNKTTKKKKKSKPKPKKKVVRKKKKKTAKKKINTKKCGKKKTKCDFTDIFG
jgi:hypothetical protein